eukprot:CAMPEP_0115532694 /NCGR_PEP_ID=MMETSP0271-20121206/85717_1 /TAXON_ID=71861 /ORGANISM="Scrippsiella trochoidea, Strain CCMP3099" /LENGTH=60 /DNA_ID=CAMNT_0002965011 /DNA_START=277 /DNA_END=459 /DNA_ORIENTATION=-
MLIVPGAARKAIAATMELTRFTNDPAFMMHMDGAPHRVATSPANAPEKQTNASIANMMLF